MMYVNDIHLMACHLDVAKLQFVCALDRNVRGGWMACGYYDDDCSLPAGGSRLATIPTYWRYNKIVRRVSSQMVWP